MIKVLQRVVASLVRKVGEVAKHRTARRPEWVQGAESGPSGSLVVVTRSDGRKTAYHMSNTSLVEEAARDNEMATTGG
jgi:hypothetical protein